MRVEVKVEVEVRVRVRVEDRVSLANPNHRCVG